MTTEELRVIQQTAVLAGILSRFMRPAEAAMYAMELANARIIEEPISSLYDVLANTTNLNGIEIIAALRTYRACMQSLSNYAFITEEPSGLTAPPMSILDIAAPSIN